MYLHILCTIILHVFGPLPFPWQYVLNCLHVRHMTTSFHDNVSIISHDV